MGAKHYQRGFFLKNIDKIYEQNEMLIERLKSIWRYIFLYNVLPAYFVWTVYNSQKKLLSVDTERMHPAIQSKFL